MSEGKTDVIILGAGASTSAKFPTNEGLRKYIVGEMSSPTVAVTAPHFRSPAIRKILEEHPSGDPLLKQWQRAGESLRKTAYLSVDEYCQNASSGNQTNTDVIEMKRVLRYALLDHTKYWLAWNDYVAFVSTLFERDGDSSSDLDSRFTVVNFNYDGLLGKLLTDALCERWHKNRRGVPPIQMLAAAAGGYYPGAALKAEEVGGMTPHDFCHYLPHGTVTVAHGEDGKLGLQNEIYSENFDHEWFLKQHYHSAPLIHFPWEDGAHDSVLEKQFENAAIAISEAKRIHFIGLSGHPLLRHSLKKLFKFVVDSDEDGQGSLKKHQEAFIQKAWHIATMDPIKERVFRNLARCFLPSNLLNDRNFVARFTNKRQINCSEYYNGFGDWLDRKPHLP